jgi:hypothetical protein
VAALTACIDFVVERLALVHERADQHYEHEQPEYGRQQPARHPVHGFSVCPNPIFFDLGLGFHPVGSVKENKVPWGG